MLLTLIRKEMMHHLLSVRFIVLLLMCLLLVPLTLSINYQHYRQNLVDYQEAVKLANIEEKTVNPKLALEPEIEISKLFLKPTPLERVSRNGLGDALPIYLGMTRNGITQGARNLRFQISLSQLFGHLDFLFVVGTVFQLSSRYCLRLMWLPGSEKRAPFGSLYQILIPRDLFSMEQINWRICGVYCCILRCPLLFGLLILVWQGFPLW